MRVASDQSTTLELWPGAHEERVDLSLHPHVIADQVDHPASLRGEQSFKARPKTNPLPDERPPQNMRVASDQSTTLVLWSQARATSTATGAYEQKVSLSCVYDYLALCSRYLQRARCNRK